MAKLGWIGIGVAGGQMSDRLPGNVRTGAGLNRTLSKADWLFRKEMRFAASPRGVIGVAQGKLDIAMLFDMGALMSGIGTGVGI